MSEPKARRNDEKPAGNGRIGGEFAKDRRTI